MMEYNKRDIISYNELHQVFMMFPIEGYPGEMLEQVIAKGWGERIRWSINICKPYIKFH